MPRTPRQHDHGRDTMTISLGSADAILSGLYVITESDAAVII